MHIVCLCEAFVSPIGLGLLVFLEIVHSYAAADEMVGLALFDGSNDCYFHKGKFHLKLILSSMEKWLIESVLWLSSYLWFWVCR